MTMSFNSATAVAACDLYTSRVNAGAAVPAPYFVVFKGTIPANVRAPIGDAVPLVTIVTAVDTFIDAVPNDAGGYAEALANAIADTPASADGIATFFRQFNRDNVAIWQGTVSEPNAGGDMELSSVNVIAGVNVVVQSYAFRTPM